MQPLENKTIQKFLQQPDDRRIDTFINTYDEYFRQLKGFQNTWREAKAALREMSEVEVLFRDVTRVTADQLKDDTPKQRLDSNVLTFVFPMLASQFSTATYLYGELKAKLVHEKEWDIRMENSFHRILPQWLHTKITLEDNRISVFEILSLAGEETKNIDELSDDDYKFYATIVKSCLQSEEFRGVYCLSTGAHEEIYKHGPKINVSRALQSSVATHSLHFLDLLHKKTFFAFTDIDDPSHEEAVSFTNALGTEKTDYVNSLIVSRFVIDKVSRLANSMTCVKNLEELAQDNPEEYQSIFEFTLRVYRKMFPNTILYTSEMSDVIHWSEKSYSDVRISSEHITIPEEGVLISRDNLLLAKSDFQIPDQMLTMAVNLTPLARQMILMELVWVGDDVEITFENLKTLPIIVDFGEGSQQVTIGALDGGMVNDHLQKQFLSLASLAMDAYRIRSNEGTETTKTLLDSRVLYSFLQKGKGLERTPGSGKKRKHQNGSQNNRLTVHTELVSSAIARRLRPVFESDFETMTKIRKDWKYNDDQMADIWKKIDEFNQKGKKEITDGPGVFKQLKQTGSNGEIRFSLKSGKYRILAEQDMDGQVKIYDVIPRGKL